MAPSRSAATGAATSAFITAGRRQARAARSS
jgi:hypothetical protein